VFEATGLRYREVQGFKIALRRRGGGWKGRGVRKGGRGSGFGPGGEPARGKVLESAGLREACRKIKRIEIALRTEGREEGRRM
jgi:hypothetical protein